MGHWSAMAGARVDVYDGLSDAIGIQPRLGITYRVDRTSTVWRAGYGRIFLTPYNENLVLASSTGSGGFGGGLLGSVGGAPLTAARRNQYDVGLQQRAWRGIHVDADYFWKVTEGAYHFDVILNTPLTFPVQFHESKIDGGLVRVTLPDVHGFSAFTTLSHTRARLFGPELGGLRFRASYAPSPDPITMSRSNKPRTWSIERAGWRDSGPGSRGATTAGWSPSACDIARAQAMSASLRSVTPCPTLPKTDTRSSFSI